MGGRDSRVLLESQEPADLKHGARQKQQNQMLSFKTGSLREGLCTLGWCCGYMLINLCRKAEPTVGGTIPLVQKCVREKHSFLFSLSCDYGVNSSYKFLP